MNGRKDVIGFPFAWKELRFGVKGKRCIFFHREWRMSTNAHDEDENMNNDSLILHPEKRSTLSRVKQSLCVLEDIFLCVPVRR